jgi:hypothetical protein
MCSGVCTCRPQRWRVSDGDEAGGGEGSILAEGDLRSNAERGIDTGVLPAAAVDGEPVLLVAAEIAATAAAAEEASERRDVGKLCPGE